MLYIDLSIYDRMFQQNLHDWKAGGPKDGGWTREGHPYYLHKRISVVSVRRWQVTTEEALAKNEREVMKWHVDFLRTNKLLWPEDTLYYKEYLVPRYDRRGALDRIESFIAMSEDMKISGYDRTKPIYVADVSEFGLGFHYFRFDGCHRLACAIVAGLTEIPAYVFRLTEDG